MDLESITEDRKITRRGFIGALGAAVTGLAAYTGLSQAYSAEPRQETRKIPGTEVPITTEPKYEFNQFVEAYGEENWKKLSKEQKQATEEKWDDADGFYKQELVEAHKGKQAFCKALGFSEKETKEFYDYLARSKGINESNIGKDTLYFLRENDKETAKTALEIIQKDYDKHYPFKINISKPSEAEKMIIWAHEKRIRKIAER